MILFEILSFKFSVCALGESQTDCELRSFFSGLESNLKKDGRRMLQLLNRVAQRGTEDLNLDICHKIEEKIYQFRQGKIRVLWFYDENKIIICTNGFVKQKQRTPKNEKDRAKSMMKRYLDEKRSGPLRKIPWEEV